MVTPGPATPLVSSIATSGSAGEAKVDIGHSVSPQPDSTPEPPSRSMTWRLTSGGIGAPPLAENRSLGNRRSLPCAACAAMYPWKKGAADDRIVTSLSARNREVAMGSNDEQSRVVKPDRSCAVTMATPPMCVTGNGSA